MTTSYTHAEPMDWKWLRNRRFDLGFILGLPALSLFTVGFILLYPGLFWYVLAIDLWVLGYHHVISTYTRLCFDKASFRQSRFLIFGLLPLVALGTVGIAAVFGLWTIVTVYFYWQWWHYTRQSWDISRAYRGKDRGALYEDGWIDQAIFYAWPVLGVLHRSYQDPGTFIGLPLGVVPVPGPIVQIAGAATAVLTAYWVFRRVEACSTWPSRTSPSAGSASTSGTTPSTSFSSGCSTPAASRTGSTRMRGSCPTSASPGACGSICSPA
jgi:hypothetical protein